MSNVLGVANSAATSQAPSSSNPGSLGQMNQNQFLQLLVAQMQYQNPMQPMSSSTFMQELAQFTTVEQMISMQSEMQNVQQASQLGTAASLIGKTVSYTDGSGKAAQGVVSAVVLSGGSVSLKVGGYSVPLGQVTGVGG